MLDIAPACLADDLNPENRTLANAAAMLSWEPHDSVDRIAAAVASWPVWLMPERL